MERRSRFFSDTSWLEKCKTMSYKEAIKDIEPFELDKKKDCELIKFIEEENKEWQELVR